MEQVLLQLFTIFGLFGKKHYDIDIKDRNLTVKLSFNLDASLVRDWDGYYAVLGSQVVNSTSGPISGDIKNISLDVNVDFGWDFLTEAAGQGN